MHSLSSVLMSSAVFVAIATGIFSLIIALINSKNISWIEKQKSNNELVRYRYVSLHKILQQIVELESIYYNISNEEYTKKTVSNATSRYYKIKKIYCLAKPLLDYDVAADVERNYQFTIDMDNKFVGQIYADKDIDFELKDLLLQRQMFEDVLIFNIQIQLQKLVII